MSAHASAASQETEPLFMALRVCVSCAASARLRSRCGRHHRPLRSGCTARYTVLQSCAAFDSSTSAAAAPKGTTSYLPLLKDQDQSSELLIDRVASIADQSTR